MERRKFIKKTVTSLPLFFVAPSLLSSSCGEDEPVDGGGKTVIVVGGGISGLAAAKKLKQKGFTVKVLESQDRIGGRMRTNRSGSVPFDEGASWIHGATGNPITTLAQEAGMTTFETVDDNLVAYDIDGVEISDATYTAAEDELETIIETLKNNGNATKSFETVFNQLHPSKANNRLWRFLLSTYLTFDLGDLDKLSSLLYDEGEVYGGPEMIATNGYDTIPTYLASGLDVALNQRVTKIDYTNNKVLVTHNNAVSEADYVLVTVPLGVLKANAITFSPSLPAAKQTAIEKIGMNCVNKFLLTWNTAFWDDVQYIAYTPEAKDKFNYFLNVKKFQPTSNSLMTFAFADYARQTENMTDAQIITEIMTHLKDIYGDNIPNPTSMQRTKWNSNTNAYGAYSYTAVGTEMQHFEDLASSINNRLFFAGEHTEVDYFSTVHGAYLSGIREADKIIDTL